MNFDEYNILGNIINTSWGVGSTNSPLGASMSVKGQLLGERQLLLSFNAIMSFGEVHERVKEMQRFSKDSESILEACIKNIKSNFKKEAGRTLKTKNLSDDVDWELLSLGQYSGRRDALFRRKIILEIS